VSTHQHTSASVPHLCVTAQKTGGTALPAFRALQDISCAKSVWFLACAFQADATFAVGSSANGLRHHTTPLDGVFPVKQRAQCSLAHGQNPAREQCLPCAAQACFCRTGSVVWTGTAHPDRAL